MRVIAICPRCGYRNSSKDSLCRGSYRSGKMKGRPCALNNFQKKEGVLYWVEYRILGKKVREKVGESKKEAETRLAEIRNDSSSLEKSSDAYRGGFMTIEELFDWFIRLKPVESMDGYPRYKTMINSLKRIIGGKKRVRDITLEDLDNYIYLRQREDSPNRLGSKISPKTVKEEMNLFRNILNRAVTYQKIHQIPVSRFPKFRGEDNIRKRIFTAEELQRMIDSAPEFMMRMIVMAAGTGMRQNEIVQLEWKWVNLEEGFVDIPAEITKSGSGRFVKLFPNVIKMLEEIPRFEHTDNVFLSENNNPIPYFHTYCRKVFKKVLEKAGVDNAVFHDLRHDFVTKASRSGNSTASLMVQCGHKTESMFHRYRIKNKEDLIDLKDLSEPATHRNTRLVKKIKYKKGD